jgi:hypothetical protein
MHYIQAMPMMILAVLGAWHMYSWLTYSGIGTLVQHIGVLALAVLMGTFALFLRNPEGEALRYAAGILGPVRMRLVGASCFLLGAIHFIGLVRAEPLFLQMGFLILILAYFETAGMANGFFRAYSGEIAPITASTLKRLVLKQLGILGLVFVLSATLLYVSLMAVVGFTATWTVALLAAGMILALVFMARARNL